jgi:hypothetical protein
MEVLQMSCNGIDDTSSSSRKTHASNDHPSNARRVLKQMSNARDRTIDALVLPSANGRTNRRIQSGRNHFWLAERLEPLVVAAAEIDVLYVADFPRLRVESAVADAGIGSQLAQHPQEIASRAGP